MPDANATSVIDACLALRISHPHVPALDTLDMSMQGHHGRAIDFGTEAKPPAPFALVVAEAFDRGMTADEWRSFMGPQADPAMRVGLEQIWVGERWPRFMER
jgi:hypothetical protein